MFLRALLAFLMLPGLVAYVVPLLLAPVEDIERSWHWLALLPTGAGTLLLLWCVREFYVSGKGTLAPWSPPVHLVTGGPYGWSRNPMYIAVSTVLLGWAIWYGSPTLLAYAIAVMIAFHLRVVLGEEPWLARAHGDEWLRYRQRVRRWL